MGVMDFACAERTDLAALLATLRPEQWEAPSLCSSWRVKDVVAHVVSYDDLDAAGLFMRFAAGRFWPDRINAVGIAQASRRSTDELVASLRDHPEPRGLPALFGGAIALTDSLIHHQDIRRPLGLPRDVPAERLRAALPFAVAAPPVRGAWHGRGVRLIATDLDWSFGRGPEARGPAEVVLMVLAGRRSMAQSLSGPGADTLVRRLG